MCRQRWWDLMKLRWLILIAFIGVTLIPVAFLGVWPQSKALQNEVDRVSDQHLLLARHLKLAMERFHRDAVAAFNLLVDAAIENQPIKNADRLMENLNFSHICVARLADGEVLSSVGPANMPCPDAIPEARLALFKSLAEEGRIVFSGVLANRRAIRPSTCCSNGAISWRSGPWTPPICGS